MANNCVLQVTHSLTFYPFGIHVIYKYIYLTWLLHLMIMIWWLSSNLSINSMLCMDVPSIPSSEDATIYICNSMRREILACAISFSVKMIYRYSNNWKFKGPLNYFKFETRNVFVKHRCPWRQQRQKWQKSLSTTFWPHPSPRGMGCQWSVRNP